MKILLTGKNGQVGFELQRALAPLGEVIAVDHDECDLANPEAISRLVRETKPDIIVNPAAYTAVDKAESDQDLATAVNAIAPGIFGEEAAQLGALVIHYSTDYVFDGSKTGAYSEDDSTNPQSVYGKTKLAGEQALQQSSANHLIFRTSWVFGAHGGNFAKTMLRLAVERDSLNVVADQYGAPTSAALIADVTAQIIGQYQKQGSLSLRHLQPRCQWRHHLARIRSDCHSCRPCCRSTAQTTAGIDSAYCDCRIPRPSAAPSQLKAGYPQAPRYLWPTFARLAKWFAACSATNTLNQQRTLNYD